MCEKDLYVNQSKISKHDFFYKVLFETEVVHSLDLCHESRSMSAVWQTQYPKNLFSPICVQTQPKSHENGLRHSLVIT